jgi:antirestriction protein ArdC|tara:strand:- start:410 stop:1252 length:843 start_codon:yes stop_codon:yes gene_type:complete
MSLNFYGKAEGIADSLVQQFKTGNVPEVISNVFIKHEEMPHCKSWSWNNQMLACMHGSTDAMTYKSWKSKGRTVKKGERAFLILAPVKKSGWKTDTSGDKEKFNYLCGFRAMPVFGLEQTEGEPIDYGAAQHVEQLPLLEVAKTWGISVDTYSGAGTAAAGFYAPGAATIQLGVKNVSTWLHELIHAAEDKLNVLPTGNDYVGEEKNKAEIVAEFGGCVLGHIVGDNSDADTGGCYKYIQLWLTTGDTAHEAAYRLINRTCNAVALILETAMGETDEQLE